MQRAQILLSEQQVKAIKAIAGKQGISYSKLIRQLIDQGLYLDKTVASSVDSQGYILDLGQKIPANPRIDGFREIFAVGGKTPEIKIIPDSVFRYFFNHRKFPDGFAYQLESISRQLSEFSYTQSLAVRRAYLVPGLENPPGPRFLGLKANQVLEAVQKIYEFAIEHEYYLVKDSQICIFIHPFADPQPLVLPLAKDIILPYGGYAVPINQKATRVEVYAVWGNNEGVQSFDAIDRYLVDTDRSIIVKKDIPQKTLMLCTTTKSESDKITVPLDRQFEQVLSDGQILEAARIVRDLSQKFGLRRIEFSFDGEKDIVFNESAPYVIIDKEVKKIDKKGIIKIISNENDLGKIRQLDKNEAQKTILYIDKRIIQDRAYDLLNSVAGLSQKFTVLYPGLSATAHAMRVLNDFGHSAIVVGNRAFQDKEEIIIKTDQGQISIESISKSLYKNYLVNLYDAKLYGQELVGGKAMNLSLLKSKGFSVPHGVVLTTKFFDYLISQTDKDKTQTLPTSITIRDQLWQSLIKSADLDGKKRYAVRSSANIEDQSEHSFAGQFESYLDVPFADLRSRAQDVIRSSFDPRVSRYLYALNKALNIKMAVVIQEMVDVDKAGVVFGKDIQTGNPDNLVIDTALGTAEGVVAGTAETQRIIYSRSKNQVLQQNVGYCGKILSRMEIDSLVEMTLSVERLIGQTQDIEWAIDREGSIWLIQTRSLI